jgi:hypothetical protein
MRTRRVFSVLLVALLALTALGCGNMNGEGKTANIESGPMPSGGSWEGVWYSELFGELHMKETGSRVEGRWMRPEMERWGKLQGSHDGNVLRFEWEEFVDGIIGPNSKKTGRGYFVYSRPEGENVDDRIRGEIGRGNDEVGAPWEAIKQRNVKPNLGSIGGSGASEYGGGDWDGSNREEGAPEPPAEPEAEEPEL